jgi:hypothetical protein
MRCSAVSQVTCVLRCFRRSYATSAGALSKSGRVGLRESDIEVMSYKIRV